MSSIRQKLSGAILSPIRQRITQSTSSRVFYNTAIQFIGRAALLVVGFISIALLTRYLGVENYGRLSIVTIFVSFVFVMSDWGITTIVTRELSKTPEDTNRIISSVIVGRFVVSIPLLLISIIAAKVIYNQVPLVQTGIILLSSTIFTNLVVSTLGSIFQVRLRNELSILAEVVSRVAGISLIYLAILANKGVLFIIGTNVVVALISAGLSIWFARILGFRFEKPNLQKFFSLLWISIPLGLAFVLNSIYFKIDTIILSFLRSATEVGLYSAAYRVLDIILIFPSVFAATIFPLLSRSHDDHDRLGRLLVRIVSFMLVLGSPILIGGWLLAEPIITLVGGHAFTPAYAPLRILIASGFISFFNMIIGLAIIAINKQKQVLWINISGLVINVILNLLLIPRYGFMAAAYNTLFSEIFGLTSNSFAMWKFTGLFITPTRVMRTLLAAAFMGAAVLALKDFTHINVIGLIMIGGGVYLGLSLLVKSFTIGEIKQLVGAGE